MQLLGNQIQICSLNPDLFKKVAEHITDNCSLHLFNTQELANTLAVYVKAGESNPALFKRVADHITTLDSLHSFDSQILMFDKVANHIISLDNLDYFISKHCAPFLRAYADANMINIPLFMKVVDHAINNIDYSDLDKVDQHSLLAAFIKADNAMKENEGTNDDDTSGIPPK